MKNPVAKHDQNRGGAHADKKKESKKAPPFDLTDLWPDTPSPTPRQKKTR